MDSLLLGMSTGPSNLLLDESDSDNSTTADEHTPNRIESQAEIHTNPTTGASTTTATSSGEGSTSTGVTDLPTTISTDSSSTDLNPPTAVGRSGEAENEGFGFDDEYFGEGATGGCASNTPDPLQVEIHGRKDPVDGKSSNA